MNCRPLVSFRAHILAVVLACGLTRVAFSRAPFDIAVF